MWAGAEYFRFHKLQPAPALSHYRYVGFWQAYFCRTVIPSLPGALPCPACVPGFKALAGT